MAGAVGLALAGALAADRARRRVGPDRRAAADQGVADAGRAQARLAPGGAAEAAAPPGTREVDIRGGWSPVAKLRDLGATIRAASKRSVRAMVPAERARADRAPAGRQARRRVGRSDDGGDPAAGLDAGQAGQERQLRRARAGGLGGRRRARGRRRPPQARVTGVGVKVCVLSDGVDSLAASQAAGELPAVDVLPGQEGDGDEGTAMLEIVHDLAPNAELGFATAFTSDASFADNIRALRFDAGCDVIVDDVLYFNESPFQDGPIAQSVNAVTADGALYFSSAGNEGNTLDGTSGNYEGDFVDSGRAVGKFAGAAHDFDPGAGVQVFEPISAESSARRAGHAVVGRPARRRGRRLRPLPVRRGRQRHRASRRTCRTATTTRSRSSAPASAGRPAARGREVLRRRRGTSSSPRCAAGSRTRRRARGARVSPASRAGTRPRSTRSASRPRRPPIRCRSTSSRATRRTRAGRSRTRSPRPSCRSASPPTGRGGCSSTPTAAVTPGNFSATGGMVRQKPDITAADGVSTSLDGLHAVLRHVGRRAARGGDRGARALRQPGARRRTTSARRSTRPRSTSHRPASTAAPGTASSRADRVLAYTGATPQPLVEAGQPTVTRDRRRRRRLPRAGRDRARSRCR